MVDVSLRKCEEYEHAAEVVQQCFEDIGGIEVTPDTKFLIKTNLLKKNRPEEMVTTHPAIIKAVIAYLQSKGAKDITIGDSPGGPFNATMLRAVYSASGMGAVAKEMGVKLNYNTSSHHVFNQDGVILKEFQISDYVTDADVIIDCAKLKTHQMTGYTGAVKNLFGCIPGTVKVEYHYRMPRLVDFSNMLLDLALYVKPKYAIIDAVYAMEGQGPSAGDVRKVGAIIASKSPTHADMIGVSLMGKAPTDICTLARAAEREIITGDVASDIQLIGDKLAPLVVHDFKPAVAGDVKLFSGRVPKFIEKPLEKMFSARPEVKPSQCIGCGICRDSCPPEAITMVDGKPVIDRKLCIKCYCCHELCPKRAIGVKKGLLLFFLKKEAPAGQATAKENQQA